MVGGGVISSTHADAIRSIDGATLVGVADIVEDRAKQLGEKYDVNWYTDMNELFARSDVDAIAVCTPSGLHADIAIAAAKAGKHVIVEKPIDVTLAKADAMIGACRDAGVKLSIISQHRFDPATVIVKRYIDEGKFGKLVLGEAAVNWYRSQGYYDSGAWRGTWAMDGGGALTNQGIHTVDLFQYLMGPVRSVSAHMGTFAHERIEVEDVAVATLQFENGAVGTMVATTAAYPGLSTRIEVFGTGGTAVIEADKLTHLFVKPEEEGKSSYGDRGAINLAANAEEGLAGGGGDLTSARASGVSSARDSAHVLQYKDFLDAVWNNREPLVNGIEGRRPLAIIQAIYQSARTGEPVTVRND